MAARIPIPDLSFDDFSVVSFEDSVPNSSPKIVNPGSLRVVEHFGFELASAEPLRCTLNSAVYTATAAGFESNIALKISANKSRLFTEFANRGLLPDSPFLVSSHDIFETDHYAMIQMELCPQGDIQGKRLDEAGCWKLAHDIATALYAVHSAGYIHLDVSPMNILMCDDGFKLCDFGTMIEEGRFASGCEGSGPYASPEVLSFPSMEVSFATDVFSLGVCLLEVASGFYAPRGGDMRYEELRNGTIALGDSDFECDYGRQFVDMVNAMLASDPSRRPSACFIAQIAGAVLARM